MRDDTGGIWFGDLVRAVDRLGPTNRFTLDTIAGLLGFRAVPAAAAAPTETPLPAAPLLSEPGAAVSPAASKQVPLVERIRSLTPRTVRSHAAATIEPLRLSAPTSATTLVPSPPLLSPLASRFIVNELVTTPRFGPEPDLERLVTVLARAEVPEPLPLREHRTLARGVQVLLDRGEGMEPFAADQAELVRLLGTLVGAALLTVATIDEVPDESKGRRRWTPPPNGTPVLALTDLGLAGRSTRAPSELVAAWRRAAEVLATRGSSLVILVPYPENRWPVASGGLLRLVVWDRQTTSGRARVAREPSGRK